MQPEVVMLGRPPLAPSEHHEMSRDDCLERLRSTTMGRIAWSAGGVQQILPGTT